MLSYVEHSMEFKILPSNLYFAISSLTKKIPKETNNPPLPLKRTNKGQQQQNSSRFVTTWMNHEGIMLSEISQTEKDEYCMILLICGIWKSNTNQLIYKTETHRENKLTVTKRERVKGGGGTN